MLEGNTATFQKGIQRTKIAYLAREAGFTVHWADAYKKPRPADELPDFLARYATAGQPPSFTAMNDAALLWLQMNHEG